MASANNAFTATQSSTCTAIAVAPMPSSEGPIRRATMKAEATENVADPAASNPDQKTFRFIAGTASSGATRSPSGHAMRPRRTSAGAARNAIAAGSHTTRL